MRKIYSIKNQVISEIDHVALHKFILNKISIEFSNMVENCYYPKIAEIKRDLLHMTSSKEKELLAYSKNKYKGMKFKLLHDSYTTLLILIIQDFIDQKDYAATESAFHLFSLRQYTNLLYRYTTKKGSKRHLCLPDVFQSTLDRLSKNHMFVKQKTIPSSIIYYSRAVLKRHMEHLRTDNADGLFKMIYEIRSRINQSMRGFFNKYYAITKEKTQVTKSKEEEAYDEAHETKLRYFISRIGQDMCIYRKIDHGSIVQASSLIKFNKKLSKNYIEELSNPKYSDQVESALYLLLKDIKDISFIKSTKFLDHIQKLMSIKVTKQQVYFKKTISQIHSQIIDNLKLRKWYDNLSIQSKAISRNFIAYYIAFFLRSYV